MTEIDYLKLVQLLLKFIKEDSSLISQGNKDKAKGMIVASYEILIDEFDYKSLDEIGKAILALRISENNF